MGTHVTRLPGRAAVLVCALAAAAQATTNAVATNAPVQSATTTVVSQAAVGTGQVASAASTTSVASADAKGNAVLRRTPDSSTAVRVVRGPNGEMIEVMDPHGSGRGGPQDIQIVPQFQQMVNRMINERTPRDVLRALSAAWSADTKVPTSDLERIEQALLRNDWADLGAALGSQPLMVSTQMYSLLLRCLAWQQYGGSPPEQSGRERPTRVQVESPSLSMPVQQRGIQLGPDDVLGLADAAPTNLTAEHIRALGDLLAQVLQQDVPAQSFLARLRAGTLRLGGTNAVGRRAAADLLLAARLAFEATEFLPPLAEAEASHDVACLLSHVKCLKGAFARRADTNALDAAWAIARAVFTNASASANFRGKALEELMAMPAAFRGTSGTAWLTNIFQTTPGQGLLVLSTVADLLTRAAQLRDTSNRVAALALHKQVIDMVAGTVSVTNQVWRRSVALLAPFWLNEVQQTIEHGAQQRMQEQDMYNDPYSSRQYQQEMQMRGRSEMSALPLEQLAALMPGSAWQGFLDDATVARVLAAQVRMKSAESDFPAALDLIEKLARVSPAAAAPMVADLLSNWVRARNPNASQYDSYRSMRSRYGYSSYGYSSYGYNPYGMSRFIPLTRALQTRNLHELAAIALRVRSMPLGNSNNEAVVSAFMGAHSMAEVYRFADITNVFGPIETMPAGLLADFVSSIRENLAEQWRNAQLQRELSTSRTEKDIKREVIRGYQLATNLLALASASHTDNWRLAMLDGMIHYDWAEYEYGKDIDLAIYTGKRDAAFASFARAAALYAATVPSLPPDHYTPEPFEQWFNATLGASDLSYLTRQQEPSVNRIEQIRRSMRALPGDAAKAHLASFARNLTGNMGMLKPEIKARYLRAGVQIAGDIPEADAARRLSQYYDELVQEITLVVRLDGAPAIGATQEFGAFVLLRHTTSIEREAGGFGKYLMNQGGSPYYYSGDAAANYRDDLEKSVKDALSKTFIIKSITFHPSQVKSLPTTDPDWRETPMAYIQMSAKDAATDRIPGVTMSLDFMDRNGKIVLPIQSPIVPVDARGTAGPRPITNLAVSMVLDDHGRPDGGCSLEIRATAVGLIPPLAALCTMAVPGFKVVKVDDRGCIVKEYNTATNSVSVAAERSWTVECAPASPTAVPSSFTFPAVRLPEAQVALKRYADADIVDAAKTVPYAGTPRIARRLWLRAAMGSGVVVAVALAAVMLFRRRRTVVAQAMPAYAPPALLTPFTVVNLLRRILTERAAALSATEGTALAETIAGLEQRFFSPAAAAAAPSADDLALTARTWCNTANARR